MYGAVRRALITVGRHAEAACGRRTATENHHRGTRPYDKDVASSPGAAWRAHRVGAGHRARIGIGRRTHPWAERLSGPDDRAPVRTLAGLLQLRAHARRHVRGLAQRLEAEG